MPAFQIFAKGLADIRLGGVVFTLAVELACMVLARITARTVDALQVKTAALVE